MVVLVVYVCRYRWSSHVSATTDKPAVAATYNKVIFKVFRSSLQFVPELLYNHAYAVMYTVSYYNIYV